MTTIALNRVVIRGRSFCFTPVRARFRREDGRVVTTFWPQATGKMPHLEVAVPDVVAALAAIQLLRASGLAGELTAALLELEQKLGGGGPCGTSAGKQPAARPRHRTRHPDL